MIPRMNRQEKNAGTIICLPRPRQQSLLQIETALVLQKSESSVYRFELLDALTYCRSLLISRKKFPSGLYSCQNASLIDTTHKYPHNKFNRLAKNDNKSFWGLVSVEYLVTGGWEYTSLHQRECISDMVATIS